MTKDGGQDDEDGHDEQPGSPPLEDVDPQVLRAVAAFAAQQSELTASVAGPLLKMLGEPARTATAPAVEQISAAAGQSMRVPTLRVTQALEEFARAQADDIHRLADAMVRGELASIMQAVAAGVSASTGSADAYIVAQPPRVHPPAVDLKLEQVDTLVVVVTYALLLVVGGQFGAAMAGGDRQQIMKALGEALLFLLSLRRDVGS